jgi:hypothetical protein
MKVSILQSNYIPWKGYFDIIAKSDVFIFHDDLQYTKNDWRNRNKIKTESGLKWLTIPCGTNEKRLICDVELANSIWQIKHWEIIKDSYKNAPYFSIYKNLFEEIYLEKVWVRLSELNQYMIIMISSDILNIKSTIFQDSRTYCLTKKKEDRVLELLEKAEADEYISGPSAKNYLNQEKFIEKNIKLTWMDYSNYKEYNQLYSPFEHGVSILDLIFNEGPNARSFLKY